MAVVVKKKLAQGATTKELLTHQIPTTKTNLKKQPFLIHSFSLAEDNEETLDNLKQTATDHIGRPISSSAILRALLRYLAQQSPPWIATQLHPLIEEEIEEGRLWGKKTVSRGEIERKTTLAPLEQGKLGRIGKGKKLRRDKKD